ncbi:MAG: ATP-binding protein [Paludibacteraceae bacterium]|nr:ATP-binding protein [Paludibacteraceae bacterium]
MEKSRKISEKIMALKDKRMGRILVFTGARQVGKTTLVSNYLSDYAYLSIEDPITRQDFVGLNASQWYSIYPKAALDEIQKAPSLIESIKATYDIYPDVRYVLLGSSQILLLKQVKESLAGRCVIFDIFPLTLPELQTNSFGDKVHSSIWQQILTNPLSLPDLLPSFNLVKDMASMKKAWDYYISFGGYPALIDEQMTDEDRYTWLRDYVRTYLERDIKDLAMMRDLEPFSKLQKAIAIQTAQTVNYASLATDLQVSAKTVQRYIEYLNLSYQTLILPAWTRNQTKRLTRAPKIHYMDFGVLQAVVGKRGGMTGSEFESMLVSELYKQAKNISSNATFYHLRTHEGREIDLLVETQFGYFAFEMKRAENVGRTDIRHLLSLQDILDKPLLHAFLLSNDVKTTKMTDNITAVNAAYFLG